MRAETITEAYMRLEAARIAALPECEQRCNPKLTMEHGWVDGDKIDASEFQIRVWPMYRHDYFFDTTNTYWAWEIHRNDVWIGNSGDKYVGGIIGHGEQADAQAAAEEYIDLIVKRGVNHETP